MPGIVPMHFVNAAIAFYGLAALPAAPGPIPLPAAAAPVATPTPDRAARPTQPAQPGQADRGAALYWFTCMACHGDRGQGLTDEWRAVAGQEDSNCWQSKCHASNHPANGFELPRAVPAVIGPGTLARFASAQQLHDYLARTMPWWNPGSLSDEQAWELTAYLLRARQALPAGLTLSASSAGALPVNAPAQPRGDQRSSAVLLAALLALACCGIILGQVGASGPRASRRPTFFQHLHPPTIPAAQARWRYTLGAGGLSVFLILVLILTGALEMLFYLPSPEEAPLSIQRLTYLVPYGGLIRNLHYWATQALLLTVGLHLLRVILTGAYQPPRRFNYLLGLGLLLLTLLLSFSGYMLRWDEGVGWALVAGANLLGTVPGVGEGLYALAVGGDEPGPATLLRFYAWHVFGLTLPLIILSVWHLFRVRRDGGIAAPPGQHGPGERITRAELVQRELFATLLCSALLLLLAAFWPAPIAPPVTPASALTAEARAPWFFLWVQRLLRLGDPFLMGVLIPAALLALLALIPYLPPALPAAELGRWLPRGGRPAQILTGLIFLLLVVLAVLELLPGAPP